MTRYLNLEEAVHTVDRLGFTIRDPGLLASAVARPATTLFGVDAYPTLAQKAAALLESVVRNHALLDGNKRTAWTLTALFLWLNGLRHTFPVDAAFDLVVGVAAGRVALDQATVEIQEHLVSR